MRALLDENAARDEKIRYSIQHRVTHLIPDRSTVRVVKHPGVDAVEISVETNG